MSTRNNRTYGIVLATVLIAGCSSASMSTAAEEEEIFSSGSGQDTADPIEGEENVEQVEQPIVLPLVCAGAQLVAASRMSGSDKLKHCTATCRTARYCGLAVAGGAGVMKEIVDQICRTVNPNDQVRRAIDSITTCSGWDNEDMKANGRGGQCAFKVWKGCDTCCNDYY